MKNFTITNAYRGVPVRSIFLNGLFLLFTAAALAQPPAITSFSPSYGLQGSSVTINGSNFNSTAADDIVYFGSVQATVTAASATQLTASVPHGATYNSITVLNTANNLLANSPTPFLPVSGGGGTLSTSSFGSGTSAGTFSAATGMKMAAGDIDGDGKADIVTANELSGNYAEGATVFRNTSTVGSPSFATPVNITIPNNGSNGRLTALALADINGDGKLDLAGTDVYGYVYVFINTSTPGSISFSPVISVNLSGASPFSIKVADFDGDGKNDILVGASGTLFLIHNTGTPGGTYSAVSFGTPVSITSGGSLNYNVDAYDFDGDGKIDMAGSGGTTTTSMFHAAINQSTSGTISFGSVSSYSNTYYIDAGRAADIDGDGKVDYVGAGYGTAQYLSIWKNNSTAGSLNFAAAANFSVTSSTESGYTLDIGDLNGDQKPDLVVDSYNANFSMFANTATPGTINASSLGSAQAFPLSSALGALIVDVDNDGKNDIVAATASTLYVYINGLTGTPLPVQLMNFAAVVNISGLVSLSWQTATEQNNSGFEIERQNLAGGDWQDIGFVAGAGNSSLVLSYSYQDQLPAPGSYAYRLKQVNEDGSYVYTQQTVVNFSEAGASPTVTLYPNPAPASGQATLSVTLNETSDLLIKVTDAMGRVVRTMTQSSLVAGTYSESLDLQGLSAGLYFCQVSVTAGAQHSNLLTKTIKLVVER